MSPTRRAPRKNYLTEDFTLRSWFFTTDHKRIALLYFASITMFFFIGGAAAAVIRYVLIHPDGAPVSAEIYNRLFTMHGIVMVWFFLVPAIPTTFGNFLLPMMIGARDVAFPKLNLLKMCIRDRAYTAPIDLDLAGAIRQANFSLYLGAYRDQTAKACHWHVPEAHPFEAWGDARAFDGTATILQPQTKPLFGGRSAIELLAALQGTLDPDGAAIVRAQWREHLASDSDWSAALLSLIHIWDDGA